MAQLGWKLTMPHSRPMPAIGPRCHELRVKDGRSEWRIVYRIDSDAVIVLDVFAKSTRKTPQSVITECKRRLKQYDDDK
jgi:phage-related protein